MKQSVVLMCLLVTAFAAPAPDSDSSEVAAHANEALRLMEMYRLYQQSGLAGNPFLPAADAPARPALSAVVDPAPLAAEDASDEETEDGNAKAAAPVNSDEAEEAEEVEAVEAEPTVVEAAPVEPTADPAAEPGVALEPAVVDTPADIAPVDGVAVNVPPVDIVPVDGAISGPGAAADAGVVDAGAVMLGEGDVPAL
ncbi:enamelin [Kryptolebias marmoratus]|uniref:enamelin n=1 Tax=Kryptolebias marmoratus TaxID=37003 RepID=UPI0007F91E94|nr:enamelin [Kryptolebias marmoratus]